jgi:hypothetical protein
MDTTLGGIVVSGFFSQAARTPSSSIQAVPCIGWMMPALREQSLFASAVSAAICEAAVKQERIVSRKKRRVGAGLR